ncbi:MAG: DUF3299 domain-containing protein, partial [Variovorax sp.]
MNLLRTPLCALAVAALLPLAGCDPMAKPKAATGLARAPAPVVVAAAAPAARDIPWEELIPKAWDPTKRFRGVNLDNLKDNDPRA